MKSALKIGIALLLSYNSLNTLVYARQDDSVVIDFQMAEKTIDWLDYIDTKPALDSIKLYYFREIAPTKGCQAIIHHWQRFTEWNDTLFLNFTLEALDLIPVKKPLVKPDGSMTELGRRRKLWMNARANTSKLRMNLKSLTKAHIEQVSLNLARKYLPEEAQIKVNIYIVLFGASSAFAVGNENGYDLLQMPSDVNGNINNDEVIETFAHEMHHIGFADEKFMHISNNQDKIMLIGILACEGIPTFFINKMHQKYTKLLKSPNPSDTLYAQQWKAYNKILPALYGEVQKDISLNLKGEIEPQAIYEKWLSGMVGKVYVVGADMFNVIATYSGQADAIAVVKDYRKFLSIYNKAANIALSKGINAFVFDKKLANALMNYKGE